MNGQTITLKTVYDLRVDSSDEPVRYRIPSYQRGYRWSPTQVTQLLEDIREFTQRENPQPEEFYCLQPLVLRANEDGTFEVVDGQQRLTTLLLILRHFNDRLSTKYQQKLYTLEYETRPSLQAFLEDPSQEKAEANIDFFHIAQAIKTIDNWFSTKESEVEQIKTGFLRNAKVIWFQLSSQESPIAAFTRLNVGKIPLTNGELIRAVFLKRRNGDMSSPLQLKIAYEWDLLEKALQNRDFWAFVCNDTVHEGSRIGFLFDLVARQEGMEPTTTDYHTFNFFNQKLSNKDADPERDWLTVKRTFMLLEEWFEDRYLYHLVGFLIWSGVTVTEIQKLANGCTKTIFKKKLMEKIMERSIGIRFPTASDNPRELIAAELDGLQYPRNSHRIRSILLLFNLATLLEKTESNMRFQFDSFKTQNWDIEHVRSVAPDQPSTYKGQKEWLIQCLAYLETASEATALQEEIKSFLSLPIKKATDLLFEPLYSKILIYFKEVGGDEGPNQRIENLVLLDSQTNRSYKNAVFAVKRHRILSLDRHGIFVPLCTRNVFLKCYNPNVEHTMFWTSSDSNGYREVMIDTLYRFFTEETIYDRAYYFNWFLEIAENMRAH